MHRFWTLPTASFLGHHSLVCYRGVHPCTPAVHVKSERSHLLALPRRSIRASSRAPTQHAASHFLHGAFHGTETLQLLYPLSSRWICRASPSIRLVGSAVTHLVRSSLSLGLRWAR